MALSSTSTYAEVLAQYQDNLRWWESSTKAANLYEAVLFLLQYDFASHNVGGKSYTRQDLRGLADTLEPRVVATADTNRAYFVRAVPKRRLTV